jgi:hypothetical protein
VREAVGRIKPKAPIRHAVFDTAEQFEMKQRRRIFASLDTPYHVAAASRGSTGKRTT